MTTRREGPLREGTLEVPDNGTVGTILRRPTDATALLVLAHGAGAGMRHRFMDDLARALADVRIATLRYEFPYVARGSRRPDAAPRLMATVRAATRHAQSITGDLPLFAGGKSMGGRMTSNAASSTSSGQAASTSSGQAVGDRTLDDLGVRGIIFYGFPLHPAGRPSIARAEHLSQVTRPMLFLQGTRDKLADLELVEPVVRDLGPRATMKIIDGADHGFDVLKRSGRTPADVLIELAAESRNWISESR